MNINFLGAVLGSFWAVWRGLLWCLKAKHRSWQFPRYWWFNKQYYSGYLLICLISQPLLIALRCDWYWSKGVFKGFWVSLRLWELLKIWWRYGQMKFVTKMQAKSYRNIFRVYYNQDNFSTELKPRKGVISQTSFSYIFINSSTILIVSRAPKSPWKDLLINTSHVSKQSIVAEILGRSTSNYYSTVY